MKKLSAYAGLACLVSVGIVASASADTIQGYVTSVYHGLGNGERGGFGHQFWNGTGEAAQFNTGTAGDHSGPSHTVYTFCADPNFLNNASGAAGNTYQLIRVTDGPYRATGGANGLHYTAAQEATINALMLAANSLGILTDRGFLHASFIGTGDVASGAHDTAVTMTLNINGTDRTLSRAAWVEGLQSQIWRTLWGQNNPHVPNLQTNAENYISTVSSLHFTGLPLKVRLLAVDAALSNQHSNVGQDQLVLIPLPPAAYAGLFGMGLVAGVGIVRRRRLASI